MAGDATTLMKDWPQYLTAAILILVRLSSLFVFVPIFSSPAISPRVKATFAIALTFLLAPAVLRVTGTRAVLDMRAILGELAVGLVFGLSLLLVTESLAFAGMLLGMQFSFSLVNLLDPNTMIETPVLGQMLNWMAVLVLLDAGLDRTLLAALIRSFVAVPVGDAVLHAKTGLAVSLMVSGVFLSGLQLAAPVMAAALTVEVTIALVGRLAPQLPAMVVSIPLKTIVSYGVLIGSLAVWPRWIEHRFAALLDQAMQILVHL